MTNNPTEKALLARGFDSELAAALRRQGYTVESLKRADKRALTNLGLSEQQVESLHRESRPPIPNESLTRVLFDNRWVCCVCRDSSRPIIIHHIQEWSESRDHSPANLAVLCSIHHGQAHTLHQLEQNLTSSRIAQFKTEWETKARQMDAIAIQQGTQFQAETWFYFNHLRIYELAIQLDLAIKTIPSLAPAVAAGVCEADGTVCKSVAPDSFMYADSDRFRLFNFMHDLLKSVLQDAAVRNISDYLDRGNLGCLVEGDIIFVQGQHTFKPLPSKLGNVQLSQGCRSANHVVVSFVFDLREATSTSAWSVWLRGTKNVGCLLRVQRLSRIDSKLHVEATVLAIRSANHELKQRYYEATLLESGLLQSRKDGNEDDSLLFD